MSNSIVTKREEYSNQVDGFYPYLSEILNTKATTVDDIETYYSLEGVKSLPARLNLGGVRKTVLVPLDLLTLDVRERIEEAKQATENANNAASNAQTAADKANQAADRVDESILDLTTEKAKVLEACENADKSASNANQAADEARRAKAETESATANAQQATDDAKSAASTARDAAANANASASNANSSAQKADEATERAKTQMQDFENAEKIRQTNEEQRKSNEDQRNNNELLRQQYEEWRQSDYEKFKEDILELVHEQDWNLLQQLAEELTKIYKCRSLVNHGEWNNFYPWDNDTEWENMLNENEEEVLVCPCAEDHTELKKQIAKQNEIINALIAEINILTGKEIPPLDFDNSTTED